MLVNRWAILGLILVVRLAMGFQFQSVAAAAPLLSAELGLDHAAVGALVGYYMLPGIVIAIPGALLGSRFADRTMVIFGVLLMALGGVVAGAGGDAGAIAAGRLLSGAGAVVQSIFVVKTISDHFEGREVITALAIMLAGFPVGIALALPVAGSIAELMGWQMAMYLTAAVCVLSLLPLLPLYPSPLHASDGRQDWRLPRRQLALVGLGALLWSFYNISYFAFLSFGPAMLVERGMSLLDAGLVISLSSWVSMIGVPLGGVLAERTGRPTLTLIVGCLVAGLCALALPLSDQPYLLSAGIGLFAAAPAGVIMAAATGAVEPRYRAQGNGIIYTVFYGGMGLCPAAVGWAADVAGTAAMPVYISGLVLLSSALLYPAYLLVLRRHGAAPVAG